MAFGVPIAALLPLVLIGVALVGYCWWDIARSEVRWLPRWAWALVVAFAVPLGGIVYLLIGRGTRDRVHDVADQGVPGSRRP